MSFQPGRSSDSNEDQLGEDVSLVQPQLFQPEDDDLDVNGLAKRHTDLRLQTHLTTEALQKRLLSIYYDARTLEEEQGVNVLYLALGFLKWYESESSDVERFAPLLLLPVELDRQSTNSRFQLSLFDSEITTNLSIQAKLHQEFSISFPDVPEVEDLSPTAYFDAVEKSVSTMPRWQVCRDDILLGFFSFAKFLMYRDLDPETWPESRPLEDSGLLKQLLETGFRSDPPLCQDDERVDAIISPLDTIHVMDADSSQALVIEEARQGRNLVVQGPPGTGKSQTITNLIAAAVKEGKTVLFVAEKMAALEVVKSRMDWIGLGPMCLELHSHKANKREVLRELEQTLELRGRKSPDVATHAERLQYVRDTLNQHADILHHPLRGTGWSAFEIIGEMVRLHADEVPPADFELDDALSWSRVDFDRKTRMLDELLMHLESIGNVCECPWRGVGLDVVIRTDVQRLDAELSDLTPQIQYWLTEVGSLARSMGLEARTDEVTIRLAKRLARLAHKLVTAPRMDRSQIADDVWGSDADRIGELVKRGRSLGKLRSELESVVAEVAWETDVRAARRHVAAHGHSWFRWLRKSWRSAIGTLRGVLAADVPKDVQEQISILDRLIKAQSIAKQIESDEALCAVARRAFGSLWSGLDSNWAELHAIVQWVADCQSKQLPKSFRRIASQLSDTEPLHRHLSAVAKGLKTLPPHIERVFTAIHLDLSEAFGSTQLREVPILDLAVRIQSWSTDLEGISRWVQYRLRREALCDEGLGGLVDQLERNRIDTRSAVDRFRIAFFETLLRQVFHENPSLAQFDGETYEGLRQHFAELDLERIELARREVAFAHVARIPSGGDVGEMKTVRRETKKKSRHLAIRRLLKEAGHAVQGIKPVFMMSPMSVAQFLEPGILEFDMLVFDEASQVQPVDALGAIARCKQVVVVGDDRQLPPTRFFSKLMAEDPDDDDIEATGDLESILGLCSANGMPPRMLQWHYRSHHHSLIAVSNREFYNDRLYVVPSPLAQSSAMGLRFHYVRNGVFDRGGKACNVVEAKQVAKSVVEHARNHPDLTLGVGTFSVAQREAVRFELELLLRDEPELQEFFATTRHEPFFVKNLENIQGDERDVIFISIGYGKDASGYMTMGFGPLSGDGGERRLNVLISRARQRCEVFSSITADDIDLARVSKAGPRALKVFLQYAATGILDVAESTGRDYDSEFERQVAIALNAEGFETEPQVGVAGFFIDIAVIDPEQPGRYILGIECDGAAYHSSRSARDRDRLRQQVLEDRGWVIHRIWSTDWYQRPKEQLRRTIEAIERARVHGPQSRSASACSSKHAEPEADLAETVANCPESSDHDQSLETGGANENGVLSIPYVEASFQIGESLGIIETPRDRLAEYCMRIIAIEAPVHRGEVARRLAALWGTKAAKRIAAAIDEAINVLIGHRAVSETAGFLQLVDNSDVRVRDRSNVTFSTLRHPDNLPPAEIEKAMVEIIEANAGATADEMTVATARLLGFKSTGKNVKSAFDRVLESLSAHGRIEERCGKFYCSIG